MMWRYCVVACLLLQVISCGAQRVAPGVPPQHYQQQQQQQQQQYQQPQQQQFQQPQQQQQQFQQGQPQQFQQGQPQQFQQGQPQQFQQGQPQQFQQGNAQHFQGQQQQFQQAPGQNMHHQQQHHQHGMPQPGQILNTANIAQEKEHIAEHLDVPIDTSKMSEQELQFHYFKMHDADNNNKLDGCELIKSLIHWHEQGSKGHGSGQNQVESKIFKDEELVTLIDPILNMDDGNRDGYIDYPEFVKAQQKAAAQQGPPK